MQVYIITFISYWKTASRNQQTQVMVSQWLKSLTSHLRFCINWAHQSMTLKQWCHIDLVVNSFSHVRIIMTTMSVTSTYTSPSCQQWCLCQGHWRIKHAFIVMCWPCSCMSDWDSFTESQNEHQWLTVFLSFLSSYSIIIWHWYCSFEIYAYMQSPDK